MKKIIIAFALVSSMFALTSCGTMNQGCCQPTCVTGCSYTTFTYTGTCGSSFCSRSWY